MINIIITKKADDIQSVELKGHSGYADSGKDIVCSAVSAIAQTALMALMDISKEVDYQRNDGYLKFVCPISSDKEQHIRQQAVLRAMEIGLKDLRDGYKGFIKLEERENVY